MRSTEVKKIGILEQILTWINAETNRRYLEEKSTMEVATEFNLTTKEAYRLCSALAKKGLIEQLDPVCHYGSMKDNLAGCGWITLEENE